MKRIHHFATLLALSFSLFACTPAKETSSKIEDIQGEWQIESIRDQAVAPEISSNTNIGFDTEQGRLSAYAGCNSIIASFNTDTVPGTIVFERVGATRMACPDMSLEKSLIQALEEVRRFELTDSSTLQLMDEKNIVLLKLNKASETLPKDDMAQLDGTWDIIKVNGADLPDELDEKPLFNFNVTEGTFSGNASCNHINGQLEIHPNAPHHIRFSEPISTMKSCANLETEQAIIQALVTVESYEISADKILRFCNNEGKVVLELIPEVELHEEQD